MDNKENKNNEYKLLISEISKAFSSLSDKFKENEDITFQINGGKLDEIAIIKEKLNSLNKFITDEKKAIFVIENNNSDDIKELIKKLIKDNEEMKKELLGDGFVELDEVEKLSLEKLSTDIGVKYETFEKLVNDIKTLKNTKDEIEKRNFINLLNNILEKLSLSLSNKFEELTIEEQDIIKEIVNRNMSNSISWIIKEDEVTNEKTGEKSIKKTKIINPNILGIIKDEFLLNKSINDRFLIVEKAVEVTEKEHEDKIVKDILIGSNISISFEEKLKKIIQKEELDTDEKKVNRASDFLKKEFESNQRADIANEWKEIKNDASDIIITDEELIKGIAIAMIKGEQSLKISGLARDSKEEQKK